MLRGLTTVAYQTSDLEAAKNWYTEMLGIEPYFARPEYVEFRVGDYEHELGLLDSKYLPDLSAEAAATTRRGRPGARSSTGTSTTPARPTTG